MMEAAKPVGGQLDRRRQDLVEGQPPVALVQGEPPVDGAGHRHAADVAPQRHHGHALGAHAGRVGPGTGAPDREERLGWRARWRDHGEDVAPEPAQVGAHDRHDGARWPPRRRRPSRHERACRPRPSRPAGRPPRPCRAGPSGGRRGRAGAPSTASEDDDRAQHLAALHAGEGVLDLVDARWSRSRSGRGRAARRGRGRRARGSRARGGSRRTSSA